MHGWSGVHVLDGGSNSSVLLIKEALVRQADETMEPRHGVGYPSVWYMPTSLCSHINNCHSYDIVLPELLYLASL